MNNFKILNNIIKYINKILCYTENVDYETFENDNLLQDACFMNLIQIGEEAQRIDNDFIDSNNFIKWNEIRGLRNKIVHDYEGIKYLIVWDTIKEDLPKLKK